MQELTEQEIEAQARAIVARSGKPRRRERLRVAEGLRGSPMHRVETKDGVVAAWRVGEGPAVMLVHGWEDDNSLWSPLIDRLIAAGTPVVAVDLPAHGHSEADTPGVPNAAEAVLKVAEALGPIRAIVGHSFGVNASLSAMEQGLGADAAVMIAPALPTRPELLQRRRTSARAEAAKKARPDMHPALEARVRELIAEQNKRSRQNFAFDPEKVAAKMNARALFVHCRDDEMWPPESSQYIAAQWQGAQLHFTNGLGHRPVARDSAVVGRIVEFLTEEAA